jgi:hypothetical protein
MGRDGIVGLLLLALSLLLYRHTGEILHPPFVPLGPEFYPRVLLGLLGGLGATLMGADLLDRGRRRTSLEGKPGSIRLPLGQYRNVLLTYLLFGGYVTLLPLVGFRVATALFVAALSLGLGPKTLRHAALSLLIAVGFTAAVHFVFEVYLKLLLPRGIFL